MQSCGCPTLWLCYDATVPQKLKKEKNGFYAQGDVSPSGERGEPGFGVHCGAGEQAQQA